MQGHTLETSFLTMKALIGFCCNISVPIEELWCMLTPRTEQSMWHMPLGLDSTNFFFVFHFVLGDKCDNKVLLTRLVSSFNLFDVVLFAFLYNSFTSSCNVSICFSNFLFCLQSAFFFAEVTGSAFFSFFEILIQYSSSVFLSLNSCSSTLHPAVFSTSHQHT